MILKIYGNGNEVKEILKRGQQRGEIVHASQLDTYSYFYVYEVYSFLNSNHMTISIVIIDKGDYTELHVCSRGGSSGIFKFDWGAGASFEENIKKIFQQSRLEISEIQG